MKTGREERETGSVRGAKIKHHGEIEINQRLLLAHGGTTALEMIVASCRVI